MRSTEIFLRHEDRTSIKKEWEESASVKKSLKTRRIKSFILDIVGDENLSYKVLSSSFKGERIPYLFGSAFASTALESFSDHTALSISPDDVWLQIISQHNLSLQEAVNKPEFVVEIPPSIDFLEMPGYALEKAKNDGDFSRDFTCDFSTTTQSKKISSQIMLMSILNKTKSIKFMTLCGIPKVRMMGTVEDWTKLKEMSKELISASWFEKLQFLLDSFIEASSGITNHKFWDSFVTQNNESGLGPNVNGHIKLLFPNCKENNGFIEINEIPQASSCLEVPWNDFGKNRNLIFIGGSFGNTLTDNYLQLEDGWLVLERL